MWYFINFIGIYKNFSKMLNLSQTCELGLRITISFFFQVWYHRPDDVKIARKEEQCAK